MDAPAPTASNTWPAPLVFVDREGCEVSFRPLVRADAATVIDLFPTLSAQSRFRRFNSPQATLTTAHLASLFDLDGHDRFALAAEVTCEETTVPVALGRYVGGADGRRADVALTVLDDWQGRGLGGWLLDALIITAHHHGFTSFNTIVTADNAPMLHLFRQRGAALSSPASGEVDVALDLDRGRAALSSHPLSRALAATKR
jgi:GNAT superfamily N-acetyltransferase